MQRAGWSERKSRGETVRKPQISLGASSQGRRVNRLSLQVQGDKTSNQESGMPQSQAEPLSKDSKGALIRTGCTGTTNLQSMVQKC